MLEYRRLLGSVNAGRGVVGENDPYLRPIFQGPQLFEALGALQQRGFPRHEIEEKITAEPVEALVPVVDEIGGGAAGYLDYPRFSPATV